MILDYSQNGIRLLFEVTDEGKVLLRQLSAVGARALPPRRMPKDRWLSIVDVHVSGCDRNDHHGAKQTGASSLDSLRYVSHSCTEEAQGTHLVFNLADRRMAVRVHYQLYHGTPTVRSWTEVENLSEESLGLEYVSSFAYAGFDEGEKNPNEKMHVWIPHSTWRREFDWKRKTLDECGLQEINEFALNRISLSNTGSWSCKEYLPMGAVENGESGNVILWQIEANGSWHWELGDISSVLYLKLSGPTEQENHWYVQLDRGECFQSVKVAVSVSDSFEGAVVAMTDYRRCIVRRTEADKPLPVIYNDAWSGMKLNPTEEKLYPIIDAAAAAGAEYFMMDAGWYAAVRGGWWEYVGEWLPIAERYPHGFESLMAYIRSRGMKPGLWLEIEVVGIHSPVASALPEECFIRRHGRRVIDHGRYLLDFRHPATVEHVSEIYRRVVEDWGVCYVKIDYNVEVGIGTDANSDSMGDGLLAHCRAVRAWYDAMREKYPHVILENCASGSMRLDYLMLAGSDLASVSDQEKYLDVARITAAASTAVLPEQAGCWAFPYDHEDEDAAAFNMVNAMLNRLYLSGNITTLSDGARALVYEGIAVYKSYRHQISMSHPVYPTGLPTYASKLFCSGYRYEDVIRLAVWRLDGDEDTLTVPLANSEAHVLYPSNTQATVSRDNGSLQVQLPKKNTAVLIEIRCE